MNTTKDINELILETSKMALWGQPGVNRNRALRLNGQAILARDAGNHEVALKYAIAAQRAIGG